VAASNKLVEQVARALLDAASTSAASSTTAPSSSSPAAPVAATWPDRGLTMTVKRSKPRFTLANAAEGNKTVRKAFAAVAAGKPLNPKQAVIVKKVKAGSKQGHKSQAATHAVRFSPKKTAAHTTKWVWTCPRCGGIQRRWTKPRVVLGRGAGAIRFIPRCKCGVRIYSIPQTVN
jgi:hypothetical protein